MFGAVSSVQVYGIHTLAVLEKGNFNPVEDHHGTSCQDETPLLLDLPPLNTSNPVDHKHG